MICRRRKKRSFNFVSFSPFSIRGCYVRYEILEVLVRTGVVSHVMRPISPTIRLSPAMCCDTVEHLSVSPHHELQCCPLLWKHFGVLYVVYKIFGDICRSRSLPFKVSLGEELIHGLLTYFSRLSWSSLDCSHDN